MISLPARPLARSLLLTLAGLPLAAPAAAQAVAHDTPAAPPARVLSAYERSAGWVERSPPPAAGLAAVTDFADLPEGQLGLAIQLGRFELRADVNLSADGVLQLDHGGALVGAPLAPGATALQGLDEGTLVLAAHAWQALAIRADDHGLLITVDGVPVHRGEALGDPAPLSLRRLAGAVHLANLVLRDLDELPGRPVNLFPADDLTGWLPLGDALWRRGPDEVLGEVGGGGQSFLVTARTFGDFLFEVWLRNEDQGNSGIQVRSHLNESGRLFGYQIEIDPSARAWSGGLYDEARRGWIDNLQDEPVARSAFANGEWNHYRIECVGPSVKAWVNGLATADVLDPLDVSGLIGLQVHSGNNTRVRWRAPRLRDLGRRVWSPVLTPASLAGWSQSRTAWRAEEGRLVGDDGGLLVAPEPLVDGALRLEFRSAGELALVLRADGADDVLERLAADGLKTGTGVHLLPGGALLVRPPAVEDWSTLAVCLAGDRVVAHLDGQLLGELRGLSGAGGRLALATVGRGALVRRVERLSEPVR